MINVLGPNTTVSSGTVAVALPTGWAVGDFLLLAVETQGNDVVTAPAGWIAVNGSPIVNSTHTRLSVFQKVAASGEVNPTIADPGDHSIIALWAFRGVDTTGTVGFVDTAAPAASSTAVSWPALSGSNINEGDYVLFLGASHWDGLNLAINSYTANNVEVVSGQVGGYSWTGGNGGGLFWIGGQADTANGVSATGVLNASSFQSLMTISLLAAPDTDSYVYGIDTTTVVALNATVDIIYDVNMVTVATDNTFSNLLFDMQMITVVTEEQAKRSNNFMNFNPT